MGPRNVLNYRFRAKWFYTVQTNRLQSARETGHLYGKWALYQLRQIGWHETHHYTPTYYAELVEMLVPE